MAETASAETRNVTCHCKYANGRGPKALGTSIPESLIQRTDRIIE